VLFVAHARSVYFSEPSRNQKPLLSLMSAGQVRSGTGFIPNQRKHSPLTCPNRNRTLLSSTRRRRDLPDFASSRRTLPQTGWGDFSESKEIKPYVRESEMVNSMAKELKTAQQLSDMIVSALHVKDVDVQIRKDHAYGWQPIVVSSPGDLIGYQRRVEEIANRLRFQFTLRD
jgi:hypothetical protein